MENNKIMPTKYWLYVWGMLIVFFASNVLYIPEFSLAILTTILVAGIATLWLAAVYLIWFQDHILWKILAIIFGGLFAVIAVILIQFVYEKLIFEKELDS